MSKLIGTNPNQVPSNADLGTAAFADAKDFLTSRGSSLSAVDAIVNKPGTVKALYVYDTSLDSDAGAWRKRVKHTSWYNEKLNTPYRGSRREFPAVALIVATTTEVTIYDADDANLPMWMVIKNGGDAYSYTWFYSSGNSAIKMRNATLVGSSDALNNGITTLNFITERAYRHRDGSSSYRPLQDLIADRHVASVAPYNTSYLSIPHDTVYDLDVTVMPNAPIDSETGLPKITIVAGTDAGVAVITHYDTVVVGSSSTGTNYDIVRSISIDEYYRIWYSMDSTRRDGYVVSLFDIQDGWTSNQSTNDTSIDGWSFGRIGENNDYVLPSSYNNTAPIQSVADQAVGMSDGLAVFDTKYATDDSNKNNGMMAHITTDYNTGWFQPSAVAASLADAGNDTTDLVGYNLVPNGNFSSTYGGWSNLNDSGEYKIYDNRLNDTNTSGVTLYGVNWKAPVTGTYTFAVKYNGSGGTPTIRLETSGGSTVETLVVPTSAQSDGILSTTASLTAGNEYRIYISGTSWVGYYDYIYVGVSSTIAVGDAKDSSALGVPFNVRGTITRTPVNAGAELLSYGGFRSTGSYLQRHSSSDFNIGTNDFTLQVWVKANAFNAYNTVAASWRLNQTTNGQWSLESVNDKMRFYVTAGGAFYYAGGNESLKTGHWYNIVVRRNGGVIEMWINGEKESTITFTNNNLNEWSDPTTIGALWSATGPAGGIDTGGCWNGDITLFRLSRYAMTEENILKTYVTEKKMFAPNAKCTMYGTSDEVVALERDAVNRKLHVGTTSGRSVFEDLVRVDYSDSGSVTHISAADDFVAEEF